MRKGQKAIVLFITMIMISALLFSGCGTNTSTSGTTATTGNTTAQPTSEGTTAAEPDALPIVEEKMTFTIWATAATAFPGTGLQSYNDVLCFAELEARTNIHIEWTLPTQATARDSFTLMIGSGEYTDMMVINAADYAGGLDKAISDGVILRLNELIDQYAPNYTELRNSDPIIYKDSITDSGNIPAFGNILREYSPTFVGPLVRTDWLTSLNIAPPATMTEYTAMLQTIKDEKNAFHYLTRTGMDLGIMGAYGITANRMTGSPEFRHVNGVVEYTGIIEDMREYLTLLNNWYTSGLIDKDFFTRVAGFTPDMSIITTDQVSSISTVAAFIGFFEAQMQDKDARWGAVQYPARVAGGPIHTGLAPRKVAGIGGMAISTACENPEIAAKWINYLYSEEGSRLLYYGVEGKTYTMIDGQPTLTDLITNNPDGKNIEQAMYSYLCDPAFPTIADWRRGYQTPESERTLNAADVWAENLLLDWTMPPSLTLTAEEGVEFASIMSDINTYTSEKIINFIIGGEPLSNFDQYVSQIKSMNIDRAIEIQQAALDRYVNR